MIRINGRGATYGVVWYDEEPPGDSGVDIVLYLQRKAPIADARHTPFLSLVTDLSVEENAIMGNIGKDCRYKIRRAESRDGLRMEFITEPESRLDEFRAFYDAFARQKSLEPSDRRWLVAACKTRQLALASATQNGETLVWHAYVVLENAARFQYSGSFFRSRDSHYRALVGRANRWLHWKDMLQLKQMGIKRYDWGGLFEDESVPEHAGVNNFKKEFGGQAERTYDCTVPVTVRGRIYLAVRDTWGRWKSGKSPTP
jgi:lipid II:glycine glycyltransferase (peptidoglycan interpeptide bridge formation enzyme)